MKKVTLFFLFTLVILILPKTVLAAEIVSDYFIDAYIGEDGSMLVNELIVPKGEFNGYSFEKRFNSTTFDGFTGTKDDLRGKSGIYNNGSYSNLFVTVVEQSSFEFIDIEDIRETISPFMLVDYATSGEYNKYTVTNLADGFDVKIFNPSGSKKVGFFISYIIEDVVVVHNDVAEISYPFIDNSFRENTKNMEIRVSLPSESSELKVWAHGPLNGEIQAPDNNHAVATIENLYAYNYLEIRMVFDRSIVPQATKRSGINALDYILEIETENADAANLDREAASAKMLMQKIIKIIVFGLYLIGAGVFFIYIYKKYDKELKNPLNSEYCREFPGDYGPAVMSYLMNNKKIKGNDVSATLLDLVQRKVLTLKEIPSKKRKKDYNFTLKKKDKKITESEEYLLDWFLNDIGDGKAVSLKEIKKVSKSQTSSIVFVKKYNTWVKKVKEQAKKENFFEVKKDILGKGSLYGLLGIVIFVLSYLFSIDYIFENIILKAAGFLVLIVGISFIVYVTTFSKKTIKGALHYYSWKGMKKFLLAFGRFKEKELPEIVLWEKYLVYAAALGVADKVEKQMKIKIKNIAETNPNFNYNTFTYMAIYSNGFSRNISSTINNSVSGAITSAVASSVSSSGSGGGGGFSGGGGGGFGGGGGRF